MDPETATSPDPDDSGGCIPGSEGCACLNGGCMGSLGSVWLGGLISSGSTSTSPSPRPLSRSSAVNSARSSSGLMPTGRRKSKSAVHRPGTTLALQPPWMVPTLSVTLSSTQLLPLPNSLASISSFDLARYGCSDGGIWPFFP